MYRLVLYCLIFLLCVGFLLSIYNALAFTPQDLFFSFLVIVASCVVINNIFEKLFTAPSNPESTYITAFILTLIAGPASSPTQFLFLILVSLLAISSKYILAIGKKHIFNPAAFGMVVSAYAFDYYASWWIGDLAMAPFLLATGFLIIRKLQRTDLVVSFLTAFIITSLGKSILNLETIFFSIKDIIGYSPVLFFSFIILTEPTTTPPTRTLRIIYGSLVAFLLAPFVHVYSIYFSPELALIIGNIFSYLASPKQKLLLQLQSKKMIAHNTYEFIFTPKAHFNFLPGQYLEWTLAHQKRDDRGMRRYFTIASSPTENNIKIGVKFYEKPSSYKKALESLEHGNGIVASQLAGEFTMPKDKNKKLVFIAGGIGVTPFRSMIKYLLDKNEKRDVVIFYANNTFSDVAYREIFDQAATNLGIKTIYTLTEPKDVPMNFPYEKGFVNKQIIKNKMPDFKERMFYISGPRSMILSFKKTLKEMGIYKNHIKTDFFPGFA